MRGGIPYNFSMKLPHVIAEGLTDVHKEKWDKQFVSNDRAVFESIWRRTQDPRNKELSGWKNDGDKRRRMLHFYDRYDVVEENGGFAFKLIAPYLWVSLTFPDAEIKDYEERIARALDAGGWVRKGVHDDTRMFSRGDLTLTMANPRSYDADTRAGRSFPDGYRHLDVVLSSLVTDIPEDRKSHPWDVLETGIRTKDTRGAPTIVSDLHDLAPFFPMQIELGCGPSIEVGIPPLHYLHRVYAVSDPVSHRFTMSPEADTLLPDIISDPEAFFARSSVPYLGSITAVPNDFFHLLKTLSKNGTIVGDVITNNFDGLSSLVGLKERYVRQYAEVNIIPHIDFHPDARSLVVIGAHADRRRIQHSARDRGLKVIYIDPEGYAEDGTFRSYPLESPQDGDLLVHMTASQFAKAFRETFPRLS